MCTASAVLKLSVLDPVVVSAKVQYHNILKDVFKHFFVSLGKHYYPYFRGIFYPTGSVLHPKKDKPYKAISLVPGFLC